MLPALNVRLPVLPLPVTYRQPQNLQVVARCSKQKVEVAERIDLAEVSTICRNRLVMDSAEDLGAAKAVLHALAQQPRERKAEELVAEQVEEAHRLLLHRIDQSHSVDEVTSSRTPRLIKPRQVLRRNSQVGIQNHQQVAARSFESQSNCISLA